MAELLLYDEWIDFHLIGVNSSFNTSTQFIFHLNSTYDTRFQRINDLDIWLDNHIIKNIPNQSNSKKIEVDLSNLFKESIILVPNYKDCNYIVKVSGWEDDIENLPLPFVEKDFIKLIKKIDVDLISTADRLVF